MTCYEKEGDPIKMMFKFGEKKDLLKNFVVVETSGTKRLAGAQFGPLFYTKKVFWPSLNYCIFQSWYNLKLNKV